MEVTDVEPADALLGDFVIADVTVIAANALVPAGTEGFLPAPVKMIAPTSVSSRAFSKASRSSARHWGRTRSGPRAG